MKKGLTSNALKLIAIITMIIDHVGYYMYPFLNENIYYLFRNIGRISMPIFAYLIIQGFLYTKNLKKYIIRILSLAITTQMCLNILKYINIEYCTNYVIGITNYLNILFSYTLSLVLLSIIDREKIIQRLSKNQNLIIKISIFVLIVFSYLIFKIDYGLKVPFIMLALYCIEKLFQQDYKNSQKLQFKEKIKYLALIFVSFVLSLTFVKNTPICKYSMLISLLFIAFYNRQKGKSNKFIQYSFYAFFPIHHIALYSLAMLLTVNL